MSISSTSPNRLGSENLKKLFWQLSIPAIITQFITMIYNMVDRIYIGHIAGIGGSCITGLGVCTPLILIITAFAQLFCTGGGPIASAELGQENPKKASSMAGTSFTMLLVCSAVLTVLVLIFRVPVLYLFGASSTSLPYAEEYLSVYALGTVFVLVSTGMNAYIIAQGATTVSMLAISSGAVLNIILDPIFIWGFHMNIRGAALATVFSQALSAAIVTAFLSGSRSVICLSAEALKPNLPLLKKSLFLGVSPFVMQVTECALSIAFNRSLLAYGGDVAVGAMTLFTSINSFVFLPVSGMCQGAQPITSYNFGAKRFDRIAENVMRLVLCSLGYTTFMWLLIMLCPRLLLQIFTSDQMLLDYSVSHIRIFFATIFIIGMQCSCQFSFLALKNAHISLIMALLRKVILLIPLIFILPCFLAPQDEAVLLAEPVADLIAATVTGLTFRHIYKKEVFAKGFPHEQ